MHCHLQGIGWLNEYDYMLQQTGKGTKLTNNSLFPCFRSLYEIQVAADRALSRKRLDFAGRLCTPKGKIAKLYTNLKVNENVYTDQDAPQFSP